MKLVKAITLLALLSLPLRAQQPMNLCIEGTPANHTLDWDTSLNFFYHLDCSTDLENWVWTGLSESGTGANVMYGGTCNAQNLFYRVRATVDPNNGGFLVEPQQNDSIDQIDGVCFSFDLSQFAALPSKIRIYQREYDSGDNWELIGSITEFAERNDENDQLVRFVRGSAVWLPPEIPQSVSQVEYEVQADVLDSAGMIVASAVRRITLEEHAPPTVSIVSGPLDSPSPILVDLEYDIDTGDTVRRLELYDNGVLIGTSTQEAEFGGFVENLTDIQGNYVELHRGVHSIVARVYDSRGTFTDSAPETVEVTAGNARPEINVTSPLTDLFLVEGDTFTVTYDPPTDPDGVGNLDGVYVSRFIAPETEYFFTFDPNDLFEEEIAEDTENPYTDLTVDTTGWEPGTYTIKVVARDNFGVNSHGHYFRVEVKESATSTFAEDLIAEIADEQTFTSFTNQRFIGFEKSSGIFTDGLSHQLQIDEGILLTTGEFELWDDGDVGNTEGAITKGAGDFELEHRVAGPLTQDAAILEFDVICPNGQLEFEYQFGSEEYDEFVGEFNDSFIVTVDGAVVTRSPDCLDIMAVNTANNGNSGEPSIPITNRHLFFHDDVDLTPDPPNTNQVEYDGMIHKMRAHVFLTPRTEPYRVRIIIADVNDAKLDSGLFIEKNSLRSVSPTP